MAPDDFIVKIRGLPFSASTDEVTSFFAMCRIRGGKDGIHMVYLREGRPSGEAFVEFETEEDLQKGLAKNHDHMGHRYIEVFKANRGEMTWVLERQGANGGEIGNDGVVRLRGLPFGTTPDQVKDFFIGYDVLEDGIVIPTDSMGRPGGEGYVQFASQEHADHALTKDREKMGHRYIEIFKSSLAELRAASSGIAGARPLMPRGGMRGGARPGPYDRGDRYMGMGSYGGRQGPIKGPGGGSMGGWGGYGGYGAGGFGTYPGMNQAGSGMGFNSTTGHSVHMRGLPFRATESEIMTFFSPLVPSAIHIHYEANGRATGEADVEFDDHASALEAMKKDKQHMQHRYVELFLQSQPAIGEGYDQSYDGYDMSMAGHSLNGAGAPVPLMAKPLGPNRGGYGGGRGGGTGYGVSTEVGFGPPPPGTRGGGRGRGGFGKALGRGGAPGSAGALGYGGMRDSFGYGNGDFGW